MLFLQEWRASNNIIFIEQLDEGGYRVLIEHGMMHIHDEEHPLLAKVHRSPRQLYVLNVTIACLVYLVACSDEDT